MQSQKAAMSESTTQFYAFGPFLIDVTRRLLAREGEPVPLKSKVFDLLLAMVEGRGRLLEKEELLKTVWPGQFVEEANLSVGVSALRKALGERAGEHLYIVTIPGRGYRFVADVRELKGERAATSEAAPRVESGPENEREDSSPRAAGAGAEIDAAQPGSRAHAPANLPAQLTPFIGRKSEAAAVEKMLRREGVRLVTLTGPGGTGKTRLALHVAANLLDAFPDGVFFVALEPIKDPSLVVSQIAQVLGVKEAAGTTLDENLKKHLDDKRMLLVLDNFEQVTAAAPRIRELLAAAPRLMVLVTTREVLRLSAEHEFQVPPLLLPNLTALPPVPDLMRYEAVALFTERATAAKFDFALTEVNAQAVAEICTQLDGLPLAIELAAARIKLLPPQAMLMRLESPFKLLTGGARDAPARQRTMREAIAWSYELLDQPEKTLFRRFAVFLGGATLDAAARVCDAEGDLGVGIEDGVESLVDKSLLRQVEQAGVEPRFAMLETIREYGLELLKASGERERMRQLHASYFLDLAERAEPELEGASQKQWLEQLEHEHDNLRAALRRSLEFNETETSLRLARALWWFWYLHGHYREGREWLDRVLKAGGGEKATLRAGALLGAGVLAFLQCDYGLSKKLLDESLRLARELDDRENVATALQVLGSLAREQGDYKRAVELHEESLARWEEAGDKRGVARSLNYVGFAAWLSGDFGQTRKACEVSRELFGEVGDREGSVWSLLNLAAAAHYEREPERAESFGRESLSISREIGYKEGIAWSLNVLGNVARAGEDYERAAAMLRESLALHDELGDRWRVASVLEALAELAQAKEQPQRAARLFAAAARLRETIGTPLPPVEREDYERHLEAARAQLGEAEFASLWDEGQATPLTQTIAFALERAKASGRAIAD
jgi:predicted ATPase/DNA-binding winged helix-turn-helix (wHTH) protein